MNKKAAYILDLMREPRTGKTYNMINGIQENTVVVCRDTGEIEGLKALNCPGTLVSIRTFGRLLMTPFGKPIVLTHAVQEMIIQELMDESDELRTTRQGREIR